MTFFVVVRGPLGAGKTTVARALATSIRGAYISIDDLLERYEWDGGSEGLFLRTNEDAAREARPALDRRAPVVFDGNFYWPKAIDDLARRLPYPHAVYALRVPLRVCVERDRDRVPSYGEAATREVYEKVRPVPGEVEIDGNRPVGEAVAAIRVDLERRGLPHDPAP